MCQSLHLVLALGVFPSRITTTSALLASRTPTRTWRRLPLLSNRQFLSSKASGDSVSNGDSKRLFPEEINILYDSKCNVCRWEMEWLQRRDRELVNPSSPKIRLTDLEDPRFDPLDPINGGVDYAKGMQSMTAVTADGKVVQGVPVFRLAYEQVGLGWLFVITQWPILKGLFDFGYKIFAKYRTVFTRGTRVESLIEAYEQKMSLEAKQQADDCQSCKS